MPTMPLEIWGLIIHLPVFALVAGRLGGLIAFQPVVGGLAVPVRVRALLTVALAALVTPLLPTPQHLPTTFAGLALGMAQEVLLGAWLGLIVRICFLGLELAGTLVATEAGLAFGQLADPSSGTEQSVLGIFYAQVAAVIFLVVGGHRALFQAALSTFETIPLLTDGGRLPPGIELLADSMSLAVGVAVRVAAPVVITLFAADVALGFVSRTVPQINVATVGFSIKTMAGMILMAVSLPVAFDVFLDALDQTVGWVQQVLG